MADDAATPQVIQTHEIDRVPVTASGRRRFTREDMFTMIRAEVLVEGGRTELIDGEFIPLAGEGEEHVDSLQDLLQLLQHALGERFDVRGRDILNIADHSQVQPDSAVWPLGTRFRDMFPVNLKLAVEISDTTRRKDMG